MGGNDKAFVGDAEVDFYNDQDFAAIRLRFGVQDNFLHDFDFSSVREAGGGKGGNLMGYSADRQYVVKELNAVDQNTLLSVSGAYRAHICGTDSQSPPNSLLCRIFMHFRHKTTGANFQVMNNCLKSANDATATIEDDYQYHAYDLKGTNDDRCLAYYGVSVKQVRKDWWMYGGQCLWSDDRKEYYEAKVHALTCKFHVTVAQRTHIVEALRYDCDWLAGNNLMDYSLILGTRTIKLSHTETALSVERTTESNMQPLVNTHEDLVHVMHMGVIDFLQVWNCMKVAANCIKICDRNKSTEPPPYYAQRFVRYFEEKFVSDATETVRLTAEEMEELRQEEEKDEVEVDVDDGSLSPRSSSRRTSLRQGSWRATGTSTASNWRDGSNSTWSSSSNSSRSNSPQKGLRDHLPAISS
jgi:hypothetical protein